MLDITDRRRIDRSIRSRSSARMGAVVGVLNDLHEHELEVLEQTLHRHVVRRRRALEQPGLAEQVVRPLCELRIHFAAPRGGAKRGDHRLAADHVVHDGEPVGDVVGAGPFANGAGPRGASPPTADALSDAARVGCKRAHIIGGSSRSRGDRAPSERNRAAPQQAERRRAFARRFVRSRPRSPPTPPLPRRRSARSSSESAAKETRWAARGASSAEPRRSGSRSRREGRGPAGCSLAPRRAISSSAPSEWSCVIRCGLQRTPRAPSEAARGRRTGALWTSRRESRACRRSRRACSPRRRA